MQKDENKDLLLRLSKGDETALDTLINNNMGLIKSIALRFKDRGTEYEDLIQIGCIGMIKAARSFDFSFNTMFSTYAVPLIIGEIRRFLRDDGQIKISRQIKKNSVIVLRAKEQFEKENGKSPKITELSDICNLSKEEVTTALEALNPIHSLYEPVAGDENMLLESVISDKEDKIGSLTDSIALKEAIKKLDKLSKQIIILRYEKELSQCQVGKILGLSQVKVSRTEKKIMDTLRQAL